MNAQRIRGAIGEDFDLGQHLIGERVAHHEAGVTSSVPQVHQTAFAQQQNAATVWQLPFVNLWLDFNARGTSEALECGHIDFIVEVADVSND